MRVPANWPNALAPALALLGLHAAAAHGSRTGPDPVVSAVGAAPAATEVCESRTINYITHTLPQQCLRTSWTSPTLTVTENSAAQPTVVDTPAAPADGASPVAPRDDDTAQEQDSQEELAASSFMSFEEWKEMMLRKSGQDPANIKAHRQREHRGDRDPGSNNDIDSFGEEGEISPEFDALAEKVSEITSPPSDSAALDVKQEIKEEQIPHGDGKTPHYRSKDAGKTCKERFSYSSFDAGATVLKTSPGAKNAKAILVEKKDSYMLLECRAKNKFVIVELSDDILIDTVVLANFEFFSSMIRKFRVSVSDRYPVKADKWVDLGTFEARNSRDIQAFLIEHPQIYTKYIRIEFLSHWGNEFYCPVSLLRVHGTRMLDTWKEPSHDDEPEHIQSSAQEPAAVSQRVQESTANDNSSVVAEQESAHRVATELGLTSWQPVYYGNFSLEMCELRSPTVAEPTPVESLPAEPHKQPAGCADTMTSRPSAASGANEGPGPDDPSPSEPASPEPPIAQGQSTTTTASTAPSPPPQAGNNSTVSSPVQKQADVRRDSADSSSTATTTIPRNKTTAVSSSSSASPTVQESFFKTVTKRLQLLESNTSLSLQYIEEQSRFLQDVLLKMERKQITRVDAFLDSLNKTVLSELRNVRTQYDQIWQSTVIALETQREQSQREIVALTSRLNVLADEVVFQKRMAILQSVLLLSCLVLVIFSRGGLAALDGASFPTFPQTPRRRQSQSQYYSYGDGYTYAYPLPAGPESPPDPTGPVGSSSGTSALTSTLAASALRRHHYSAPASSSTSFKDKSLPLTPPSEYSRESTPATHLTNDENNKSNSKTNSTSPEPSFYGIENVQNGTPLRENITTRTVTGARAGTSNTETSPLETDPSGGGGDCHGPADGKEEEQEEPSPPLVRTRSSVPHPSGPVRKPLPALPEDPN